MLQAFQTRELNLLQQLQNSENLDAFLGSLLESVENRQASYGCGTAGWIPRSSKPFARSKRLHSSVRLMSSIKRLSASVSNGKRASTGSFKALKRLQKAPRYAAANH
jgi:hypothetical protein